MRMRNKLGAAILAMALLGAGAVPATAQKSADMLRIVMRDALPLSLIHISEPTRPY